MVQLAFLDWVVIAGYCALSMWIGIYFSKKAGQSVDEFFLSGRSLSWWLAGTSMVATSFATDAPLAATRLVREQGLAGLWFPLSWIFADLLTLYFFARLWRRATVTTDAEISEIRYSGKSAALLRLFNGLYSSIPLNCIIMGWVTLAMVKILQVSLDWPKEYVVPLLVGFTAIYTIASGLWGVIYTDLIQFIIATAGAILLAIYSVIHIGGVSAMKEKVIALPGFSPEVFNFWPSFGAGGSLLTFFIVVMAVQWWAQKNVAGGGQLTQRMFACKNEKHSMLSVLWFSFAHYVLRPWPWMIVALASLVLWPQMADNEAAYPRMIMQIMPVGLRGVLIASLMAAFMSTLSTHLDWGASYLIVDVYKRFIKKNGSERHYVFMSRMAMALLTIVAGITAFYMDSIVSAWKFLATLTAGVGPVFILRWYWWRINAWSEIAALAASGVFSTLFMFIPALSADADYPTRLLLVLSLTTASWLIATFLTQPEDEKTLVNFYRLVRPAQTGWKHIALRSGVRASDDNLFQDISAYLMAAIFMLSSLFAIGKWLLGFYLEGLILSALTLVSGAYVWLDMKKRNIVWSQNEASYSKEAKKIPSLQS
ncbi:MAG: Na+:solute symporter [Deltaproteobacteria bacterium]|nr:Na+:solute symporter [Deltaproteobacteria bacterium]